MNVSFTVHVWARDLTDGDNAKDYEHYESMTALCGTTEAANDYASRVLHFAPDHLDVYVSLMYDNGHFVANTLDSDFKLVLHDVSDDFFMTCPSCNNDHHYKMVFAQNCAYSHLGF